MMKTVQNDFSTPKIKNMLQNPIILNVALKCNFVKNFTFTSENKEITTIVKGKYFEKGFSIMIFHPSHLKRK